MNTKAIGKRCWVIPDGFIPCLTEHDSDNQNGYVSHECACILNASPSDAQIKLTIYFEDAEPVVINDLVVASRRCWHMRMDELKQNEKAVVRRGVPYGLVIKSSEPIVVQMSRLDTTQTNMAFLSTMGYATDE